MAVIYGKKGAKGDNPYVGSAMPTFHIRINDQRREKKKWFTQLRLNDGKRE